MPKFEKVTRENVETLVRTALAKGDPGRAAVCVIEAHREGLRAQLAQTMSEEDDINEVLLRTALAVVEQIGSFRWESSLGTWYRNIGVHKQIDLLRQLGRDPEQAVTAEMATVPVPETPSESQYLRKVKRGRVVAHLMGQLLPHLANAFWLKYVDEMTWDEVAQAVSQTPLTDDEARTKGNALKVSVSRAMPDLRDAAKAMGLTQEEIEELLIH